ncbi:MAG TPA: RNA 2'-phosphotransferase [Polyangiaceae bacterium]|nr:RNA 2'-phosphotransferase [Polyangiaceae bacterium]
MAASRSVRASKFLSLVLRHEPARVGIELDAGGWVDVDVLLAALARAGTPLTRGELDALVEGPADKRRFAYDEARRRVRASHGHSVDVALDYEPATPPELLYHGTVARFLASIRAEGLAPRARQYVHLSETTEGALEVARRRGEPLLVRVAAGAMAREGRLFFPAPNRIWLTDAVPTRYLTLPPP